MRIFTGIILLLIFIACNNNSKKHAGVTDTAFITPDSGSLPSNVNPPGVIMCNLEDTILTNKIEDKLLQLPFVKSANENIDSLTHHNKGIAFITDTCSGGIHVMAGFNGDDRFETYYHFKVDRKTLSIQVMDLVTGDYMTPKEYMDKNGKD